ncbi:MAG: acyl-CoA reductase [Mucilaginibacter sp.]|nr:acyl-CoA reductase [Mucilaginibacter sp.]
MSKLSTKQLIQAFSLLGNYLINPDDELSAIISSERQYNAWFTTGNVTKALTSIGKALDANHLAAWLNKYDINKNTEPKKVGLILAGNIPLVGFHDVLCVLVTGNYALIKTSAQDAHLIKYILQKLVSIEPVFANQYSFVDRLENFDAVIATGSNNSSRYFEYYFSKVPHIIRKNRNSLAVLTGHETADQLYQLGHDIFDYYGLGCRNVSKLLVPPDYDFTFFFQSIQSYQPIIDHHKYNNNYDYNKSIYLVNSEKHFDNGFLLVKEDAKWVSPLAVLYYEYYDKLQSVENIINEELYNLQCVVSSIPLKVKSQVVDFGMSQQPALWDYADGIDTMDFLSNL